MMIMLIKKIYQPIPIILLMELKKKKNKKKKNKITKLYLIKYS